MAKYTITRIFTANEIDDLNRAYFRRHFFDEAWYYKDTNTPYEKREVDPRPRISKNLDKIEEYVKKTRFFSLEVTIPYRCSSYARDKRWVTFDITPLKNDLYKVTYDKENEFIFFSHSQAWNLI